MKVKYVKSGACANVNDSFGARLIQQGAAVYVKDTAQQKTAKKESAAKPAGDA